MSSSLQFCAEKILPRPVMGLSLLSFGAKFFAENTQPPGTSDSATTSTEVSSRGDSSLMNTSML